MVKLENGIEHPCRPAYVLTLRWPHAVAEGFPSSPAVGRCACDLSVIDVEKISKQRRNVFVPASRLVLVKDDVRKFQQHILCKQVYVVLVVSIARRFGVEEGLQLFVSFKIMLKRLRHLRD